MDPIRTRRTAWLYAVSAVIGLMLLSGCGIGSGEPARGAGSLPGSRVQTAYGAYTNVTPAELAPMLENKDFFLVDVHTPPEGRLPKTDARVRFDQVEQQIDKFPADKGAKIVLSCRSGRMSSIASETLVKLGYSNVYNLEGGMIAWKAAGYEIIPEGK